MDEELKKEIIIENFENPFNKSLTNDNTYDKVIADNTSCVDKFKIEIKMEDNKIIDMHYDGEGCAISTSSTSVLLKLLIGKSIDEALDIIMNFENMINERNYKGDVLEEALAFSGVAKQPARKKCALVSYASLRRYLESKRNL